MAIALQTQLLIFTMDNLQSFARKQNTRLLELRRIITSATDRIETLRKSAAPPAKDLTLEERHVLRRAEDRRQSEIISKIRREADQEIVPILREINAAAEEAKVRAERHHDKFSILRRATAPTNGPQDALRRRAAYATILDASGAVELARFAQQAIDTGDAILGDAVLRENGRRSGTDQPFVNGELLKRIPNAEHVEVQGLLQSVLDRSEEAGLAYSEFERGRPDSLRRIALGLRQLQRISEPNGDGSVLVKF